MSIEEEWRNNFVCCKLIPLLELAVNINMPAATDSVQNKWIVILCISSANRSKETSRNNLNKKNHYAVAVSNPAGDGGTMDVSLAWEYCASSGL
jgi:hypothetical protein